MNFIAEIPVRQTLRSGIHNVDFKNLEFGKYVSDHMLICDYSNGYWGTPQILPYSNLS